MKPLRAPKSRRLTVKAAHAAIQTLARWLFKIAIPRDDTPWNRKDWMR